MSIANQAKSPFKIIFSDLLAFVPNQARTQVWVLFPKCGKPTQASVGDPNQAHFPVVAFHTKNQPHPQEPKEAGMQPRIRKLALNSSAGGAEEEIGLWYLKKQHLEIHTQGAAAPLKIDSSIFEETAHMSVIQPQTPNINPICLGDEYSELFLGARMLLTSGTLRVRKTAQDPNGIDILWRFRPAGTGFPLTDANGNVVERRLAVEMELAFSQVSRVELVASAFDEPDNKEALVLYPTSGEEMVVAVKNEPAEEMVRLPWELDADERKRAKHFEGFYQVAAASDPPQLRIPYIYNPVITSGTLHCPPAVFEP